MHKLRTSKRTMNLHDLCSTKLFQLVFSINQLWVKLFLLPGIITIRYSVVIFFANCVEFERRTNLSISYIEKLTLEERKKYRFCHCCYADWEVHLLVRPATPFLPWQLLSLLLFCVCKLLDSHKPVNHFLMLSLSYSRREGPPQDRLWRGGLEKKHANEESGKVLLDRLLRLLLIFFFFHFLPLFNAQGRANQPTTEDWWLLFD